MLSLYLTELKLECGPGGASATRASSRRIAGAPARPDVARARLGGAQGAAHATRSTRVRDDEFPVAVFETLLAGYEELLRLEQRGATVKHLSEAVSELVRALKQLRLEVRLRGDVQRRIDALIAAHEAPLPDAELITPTGAFYACIRLAREGDERGVHDFLRAIARHRKVDVTYAGHGYVRVSLGGQLSGDDKGYERFEKALEVYLGLLPRYWERLRSGGRDVGQLDALFAGNGPDDVQPAARRPRAPASRSTPARRRPWAQTVRPSERGIVYCIEEGKSVADKIFVAWQPCETRRRPAAQPHLPRGLPAPAQEGVPAPPRADGPDLRRGREPVRPARLPRGLPRPAAHRPGLPPAARRPLRRVARREHDQGARRHARHRHARREGGGPARPAPADQRPHQRADARLRDPRREGAADHHLRGRLRGAHRRARRTPALPAYLRRLVEGSTFAGVTAALDPAPEFVTGAAKRVSRLSLRLHAARRDAGTRDEA